MLSKKLMIGALLAAALVWPAGVAARPADQVPAAPALAAEQAPPPPSSIAVSAADEYDELRSAAGTDGVPNRRSPDAQASDYASPSSEQREDGGASGFDLVSGALGLAAGIALAIAAVGLAGGLARVRLPRRHVVRS